MIQPLVHDPESAALPTGRPSAWPPVPPSHRSSAAPSWFSRPAARAWTCAPAGSEALEFHRGLAGYAPTPLIELPSLADELGVGRVFVKDESARLGLPAFKALGVFWAVQRVLSREPVDGPIRLVTATDGNHGRALARCAALLGHHALVFVPTGVPAAAVAAIAAEGAQVTRVIGSYDDAVRQAARAADEPGSVLVQDTAWPGYEQIPGWIVEGYATLFAEIDAQLREAGAEPVGLLAVPVGVGSLAQAAVTHYRAARTDPAPALLAVEPVTAACVLAGLVRGRSVTVTTGRTSMAGLNCGTPSSIAWPFLRDGLDAAVTVTDRQAGAAARDLAFLGVGAGPCGAAALAGSRAALTGSGAGARRADLGLGPAATLVLLSTEGAAATEPSPTRPGPGECGPPGVGPARLLVARG